jgi:hypothetical protein
LDDFFSKIITGTEYHYKSKKTPEIFHLHQDCSDEFYKTHKDTYFLDYGHCSDLLPMLAHEDEHQHFTPNIQGWREAYIAEMAKRGNGSNDAKPDVFSTEK